MRNLRPIWIMFFYIFFCNIIKVIEFLYRFFILLHLIFSLPVIRSLLVPYAHVSIESIDSIFLSSFLLKAILLNYSVKTCLWLLNLYCLSNIDLLFLMKCLWFLKTIYVNFIFFFIIYLIPKLIWFQQFLSFSNSSFLFITHIFVPLVFSFHYRHL